MLPDPAREQVLAALATERKLAYATLSAHRAPESSRPDLQNFEAHRSLRTIRIVNHALGLNSGSLPSLPLDLSAIITALRQALVDGSRRPSNVDLALIDSLAAIVAAREAAPALVPTDFEPPVAQSLVDPSARCRRALDGDNPFSLCDLQAHVWNIIADRGAESEKNLAAYACLLALRDGSTISPQTVAEAIACLPRDLLSLEYFCIRSLPVYGSDRPGPATYIAVSHAGGDPSTLRFMHCLSNRQENDREIADMRGHLTGENEVERRAAGMMPKINITIVNEPGADIDLLKMKGLRVYHSIFPGHTAIRPGLKRITVRPAGDIHRVPFEVLPWQQGRLGDSFAFYYCPVSTLLQASPAARPVGSPPLVIAACDYDESAGLGGVLQIGGHRGLFDGLPGSAREGEAVAALLDAELLTGPEADRPSTIAALRDADRPVIHFATHSFFVDRERFHAPDISGEVIKTVDPRFAGRIYSAIVLAGANDYVAPDQRVWLNDRGLIGTCEILRLDLRATALVTLSSCESGIGAIEVGGELDSLREALLAAGVDTVVASLWPVNDHDTADFMTAFYRLLKSGEPVSQALLGARNLLVNLPTTSRYAFVSFGADIRLEWRHESGPDHRTDDIPIEAQDIAG